MVDGGRAGQRVAPQRVRHKLGDARFVVAERGERADRLAADRLAEPAARQALERDDGRERVDAVGRAAEDALGGAERRDQRRLGMAQTVRGGQRRRALPGEPRRLGQRRVGAVGRVERHRRAGQPVIALAGAGGGAGVVGDHAQHGVAIVGEAREGAQLARHLGRRAGGGGADQGRDGGGERPPARGIVALGVRQQHRGEVGERDPDRPRAPDPVGDARGRLGGRRQAGIERHDQQPDRVGQRRRVERAVGAAEGEHVDRRARAGRAVEEDVAAVARGGGDAAVGGARDSTPGRCRRTKRPRRAPSTRRGPGRRATAPRPGRTCAARGARRRARSPRPPPSRPAPAVPARRAPGGRGAAPARSIPPARRPRAPRSGRGAGPGCARGRTPCGRARGWRRRARQGGAGRYARRWRSSPRARPRASGGPRPDRESGWAASTTSVRARAASSPIARATASPMPSAAISLPGPAMAETSMAVSSPSASSSDSSRHGASTPSSAAPPRGVRTMAAPCGGASRGSARRSSPDRSSTIQPRARPAPSIGPPHAGGAPFGRLGRDHALAQQIADFVIEGGGVVLAVEGTALPALIGPGAGDTVEDLAGIVLGIEPVAGAALGPVAPQEGRNVGLGDRHGGARHAGLGEAQLGQRLARFGRPCLGQPRPRSARYRRRAQPLGRRSLRRETGRRW